MKTKTGALAAIALCLLAGPLSAQQPAPANIIPDYFVGTFEGIIPKFMGETNPRTKILMQCQVATGCTFSIEGTTSYTSQKGIAPVAAGVLDAAKMSLAYSKEQKDSPQSSKTEWPAKHLHPLLASEAKIDTCVYLPQSDSASEETKAKTILCKLDKSPWDKPVLLMMLQTSQNQQDELFSGYEITPLFKKTVGK